MSGDATRPLSPSQTVGPFFSVCLTGDTTRGILFPERPARLRLTVRVFDGADQPVSDAALEIWQACDVPGSAAAFGRLGTDENGACTFDTVLPCEPDGPGARHISICLFARGLLHQLYTRAYFAGDARLAADPVLALVPAERRGTLAASSDSSGNHWTFDIRLQGPRETVFFLPEDA